MSIDEFEVIQEKVKSCVQTLSEYCDVVQILASTYDSEGTTTFFKSHGNYHTRQGMAQEFLKTREAIIVSEELAQHLKDES